MSEIRLAIVGAGNCASSLVQGLDYYREEDRSGLIQQEIGGYRVADIRVVAVFDVDERKVGKPLGTALRAEPNCTPWFARDLSGEGPVVQMGPVLDGVAPHMADYPAAESFRPAQLEPVDVVKVLRDTRANVLINYLPVGSEQAVRFYAEACLEAGARFIVAPWVDATLAAPVQEAGACLMLGALTPTEVRAALQAGADVVKIFPAGSVGGPAHIKALRAVFPDVAFCPTGGVDARNAPDYLAAGAAFVGIGGKLVDEALVAAGDRAAVMRAAEDALGIMRA